eukprot:SM000004S15003  [mRNA]  locus=s4:692209:694617:+ [translate_table: standard]
MASSRATAACTLALLLLAAACALADNEIMPAPASIGVDVPATYFGPSPSMVQKELIGPYQLLKSGTIDLDAGTITIPLYRGSLSKSPGTRIWYVITDTDDATNAAALGINLSGKLTYAGLGARVANFDGNNRLVFNSGTVDFTPVHSITPGISPNFFPPRNSTPGSMGSPTYTPIIRISNAGGHIYNAPIVAGNVPASTLRQFCNGTKRNPAVAYRMLHDKVTAICPSADGFGGTVTLQLTSGFSFGRPVLYLSLDADSSLPATMESVTFAPGLSKQDTNGDDNFGSPVERLFAFTNGYTNMDVNVLRMTTGPNETVHPLRQGFNSALHGDGWPLNVLGGIPTVATDYSPLWDLNVGEWTEYAIKNNYRTRILRGYITAPGGGPFGSFDVGIVNCPIAYRFL